MAGPPGVTGQELPPGAVAIGTKGRSKGLPIDGFGRIVRSESPTIYTPAPGGLTPAFGLPAGPGETTLDTVSAQRFKGLSWIPAGQLEVDEMIDLQRQMEEAGFYEGPYTLGVWDHATARAYEKMLRLADERRQPLSATLQQALDEKAKRDAYDKLVAANKKPPLKLTLSNPEDIKAVVQEAATDLYGYGNIPEETVSSIVAAIHDSERAQQMATYNAQDGEEDSVTVQEMSPQLLIEQKLKEANPNQAAARAFGKTFEAILGSIGSPVNLSGPNG